MIELNQTIIWLNGCWQSDNNKFLNERINTLYNNKKRVIESETKRYNQFWNVLYNATNRIIFGILFREKRRGLERVQHRQNPCSYVYT